MIIRRIYPLSVARIAGICYGIVGLVIGAMLTLLAHGGAPWIEGGGAGGLWDRALFSGAAILVFPLLYGGITFCAALVGAALYNLVAQLVGGVELDVS